ncbi:peptide-methionine (S)-S-oxide reductase MsrA [Mariniblastus fucicola]|uniref:Peptide methionine sulfoxide reductase MsrA n=1 Tax=Mariniblastus fucicola TaxID=980251 RepID=A0A5B9P568_9BACT|nr:peptide-methionine (S)-S-oxide reductase MsrA [Mariniblastus fucicola]QEG20639.1 Peptide methionine sulfoxide reductase MsrA [Mariniblastus fucicola]
MKIFSTIVLFGMFAIGCSPTPAQKLESESGQQIESAESTHETGTQTAKTDASEGDNAAKDKDMNLETATFGGGCFWCTEAVFLALEGVDSVLPGYMGGHIENPTYEQVCAKTTGHAEVIQIKFDPEKISYEDLLFIFFKTHDPTTLNRQGNDVGPQYRSAVFYHNDAQKASADSIIKKIDEAKVYSDPIVTEVTEAATMYVAEDYHVNYFAKNPENQYCRAFIPGKIEKLKKLFGDKLKSQYKK